MKKLMCGNWKANCTLDTFTFLTESNKEELLSESDILLALPSIYLSSWKDLLPYYIQPCAQDISEYGEGSYTGEICAKMLNDFSVKYTILGHSERFKYFGETFEIVIKKLELAIKYNIRPIVCVGESLDVREKQKYIKYIENQMTAYFKNFPNCEIDIAYEPVWAIGSGKTASSNQIQEVVNLIKTQMRLLDISGRIIYGGSVNFDNILEIFKIKGLHGVLIGNASLNREFFDILHKVDEYGRQSKF